jgi:Flp pilus assembly protein TadD
VSSWRRFEKARKSARNEPHSTSQREMATSIAAAPPSTRIMKPAAIDIPSRMTICLRAKE